MSTQIEIKAVEVDPSMTEVRSPAEVRLKEASGVIDFHIGEAYQIGDGQYQLPFKLEIKAWVCPWCGNSTEFIELNEMIILGMGIATFIFNGKVSDCCGNWICQDKRRKWHNQPAIASGEKP